MSRTKKHHPAPDRFTKRSRTSGHAKDAKIQGAISLDDKAEICVALHTPKELAIGWLRYEAVRKMTPHQFGEVCRRNIRGEFFDDIITESV